MRHSGFVRATAFATLLLVFSSCVATQLPPISSQGRSFKPLRDEVSLWQESREEEKKLLGKVELYDDPLLDSYLEQVVSRLNPRGMAANPEIRYRVRVVADPSVNAFAYPHGSIYIHTGLLARLENEDELATVLGHEMTHVENRHMLRHQRTVRDRKVGLVVATAALAVIVFGAEAYLDSKGHEVGASALNSVGESIVELGLDIAFTAAVNGYGRGLETEADEGGFRKMTAAGYDLRQAPKVYQVLLDNHGEPRRVEAFFFGSHPRLSERIEDTNKYLKAHPAANVVRRDGPAQVADAFARCLRPVVREDARLNIGQGYLRLAESELDRARALEPEDAETHFLRGRLRLAQAAVDGDSGNQQQLRREAEDAFLKSIELDPRRPAAHRELGILLYDRNQLTDACVQLQRYAELAPAAADMDNVLEMQKDGHCQSK